MPPPFSGTARPKEAFSPLHTKKRGQQAVFSFDIFL
jgi:hypothetical protein